MVSNTSPWWNFPRIDNFGQPDPELGAGGKPYWKPDTNVQLDGDYPIIAALPGIVTNLQVTSWGQHVITIKLDDPINTYATHTAYQHMSSFAPGLSQGQHVIAGQLIGYNNPTGQVPLGFSLYSGDVYGSGSAWDILQADLAPGGSGYLNPVPLIHSLQTNSPITSQGSPVGGLSQLTQKFPQLAQLLGGASFEALLGGLILGAVVVSIVAFIILEVG